MAEAASHGAGAMARLIPAATATPDALLAATGYLFVAPENLGALSGAMKEMFDVCYYPLLDRIAGRPYAAMIAAGSAGQGALAQLERIVIGWRLKPVAEPIIVNLGAQTAQAILAPKRVPAAQLAACRHLGKMMAQGLELGIY